METPSTPRRRANENDGIRAKWKVSWKPPLPKPRAPVSRMARRKEIPAEISEYLY